MNLRPQAILFDLFGTIIAYGDVEAGTRASWLGIYGVVQRLGAGVSFEEFVPLWEAQFARPLTPEEDIAETPFLSKMLRLFRHYGLPQILAAAQEAVYNCLDGWSAHIALPDDALPTLQTLHRGHRLALVSNFDHPPYAHSLLSYYGLTGQFDTILISGDLRIDKPDPRIFWMALDILGCQPQEALFVGDSLEADMAGAGAIGCRTVLIDMAGRHPSYVGERIRTLSELLTLLA